MPISHQLGCVFVHIPKTGGTSVETALGLNGRPTFEDREKMFGPIESDDLVAHGFLSAFLQHLTLNELRSLVPSTDRLFSFSFVRNPWDKIVSSYHNPDYSLGLQAQARGIELRDLPFAEFVRYCESLEHIHLQEQHRFVCDQAGRPKVDFLGHFENLQNDFRTICDRLEVRVPLPHRCKSSNRRPYREYYDDATRERVFNNYRRDIEIFGYDF